MWGIWDLYIWIEHLQGLWCVCFMLAYTRTYQGHVSLIPYRRLISGCLRPICWVCCIFYKLCKANNLTSHTHAKRLDSLIHSSYIVIDKHKTYLHVCTSSCKKLLFTKIYLCMNLHFSSLLSFGLHNESFPSFYINMHIEARQWKYMYHQTVSSLIQVMACCLFVAPSHYLYQCWLTICQGVVVKLHHHWYR